MPILLLDQTRTNGLSSDNFVNYNNSIVGTVLTTYNLGVSDNGKVHVFAAGAAVTVNVPAGLPLGFSATFIQAGTGQVTIQPAGGSGVTINSDGNKNKIASQHSSASLICYAANVFNLAGNLTL
jgi:hypothetical protein